MSSIRRAVWQWMARVVARVDQATMRTGAHTTWVTSLAGRVAPRFRACWLLMDRDTEAHDNAEHLYQYLRSQRPEINAWFVLDRSSPDWPRLAAAGFRLIAHRSWRHLLALAQCHELVSSQIDHYVVSPPLMVWLRHRPWWFTWLQHGVIQSDLSEWLRGKPARTVVATTPAERESLSRPPYTWTDREVVLTGQPRHDLLVRTARTTKDEDRTLVVVAPTWRNWLLTGTGTGNARVPVPAFTQSQYVALWRGLLESHLVRQVVESNGLELVFLPHPNMAPHVRAMDLPDDVRVVNHGTDPVPDLLARAALLVTDYSSMAFDAALIDRPVLYFQFDFEEVHSRLGHIGRRGYFDYDRDGFGPVATALKEAEGALARMIEAGKYPAEPYATRIRETFIMRDGHACERVTDAIVGHRSPGTPSSAGSPGVTQ